MCHKFNFLELKKKFFFFNPWLLESCSSWRPVVSIQVIPLQYQARVLPTEPQASGWESGEQGYFHLMHTGVYSLRMGVFMWYHSCEVSNMTRMNLSLKQKQAHRHREQTCGCCEGGSWGEKNFEFGISRCKLLCVGWINNEAPQYSIGSCIQYPVINHSGK